MLLDNGVSLLYNTPMLTKDRPLKSRLAELREAAGMTQTELARAVGVQQHSISNMENGLHGIKDTTKVKICKALGCDLSDLLYIDTAGEK